MKIPRPPTLFRFKHPLLKTAPADGVLDLRGLQYRADGPVGIFDDLGHLLGFASIEDVGTYAIAHCSIDSHTPEAFELASMTRKYWFDAIVSLRGYTSVRKHGLAPMVVHVERMIISGEAVPGQEPIDGRLGEDSELT